MCPVEMGAAPVYRQRMAQLAEVLAEDDNAEARDVVRGLVETIRLEQNPISRAHIRRRRSSWRSPAG